MSLFVRMLFTILSFFLLSNTIWATAETTKISQNLSKKLDNLGSFQANYIATRNKDNKILHIRLLVNRKDKFTVIKLYEASSENGLRVAVVFHHKEDMRQMIIFPKNLTATYFSSNIIVENPYNILMVLAKTMHKIETGKQLKMKFNRFAPTIDIRFDKKNIEAYVGISLEQKSIMANWLSQGLFSSANKIKAGRESYKIFTNDRRVIEVSSKTGLLIKQEYFSLNNKKTPLKTLKLISYSKTEYPKNFQQVFPFSSRLKINYSNNLRFTKNIIKIIYGSVANYFNSKNDFESYLKNYASQIRKESLVILENLLNNYMVNNSGMRNQIQKDINLILKPAFKKRINKKLSFRQFCSYILKEKLKKNNTFFKSLSSKLLGRQSAKFAKFEQFSAVFKIMHQSKVKPLTIGIKSFSQIYRSNFTMAYWRALLRIAIN